MHDSTDPSDDSVTLEYVGSIHELEDDYEIEWLNSTVKVDDLEFSTEVDDLPTWDSELGKALKEIETVDMDTATAIQKTGHTVTELSNMSVVELHGIEGVSTAQAEEIARKF